MPATKISRLRLPCALKHEATEIGTWVMVRTMNALGNGKKRFCESDITLLMT